jgi:hypothetical protein
VIVRIILPTIRKDIAATRHGKHEKTRKITEYLLFDRSGGSVAARYSGVIFLTVTA